MGAAPEAARQGPRTFGRRGALGRGTLPAMRRPLLVLACAVAVWGCGGSRPAAPDIPPPPRSARAPAPEAFDLAPTFAANAGRLPWPASGTVTGFFGRRTDPETKTRTDAVGVDIATAPRAPVRAVFGGRVSRVGAMAAFGTYVMLKHDGYTTVYGNLSRVDVQAGDAVGTGAGLGASGEADGRRGPALFFAVYRGAEPVDPLPWLRARGSAPAQAAPEATAPEATPGAYVPRPLAPRDTTRRRGWR